MVWEVIVVTGDFTISLLVTYPQHHAKTMQQENSCATLFRSLCQHKAWNIHHGHYVDTTTIVLIYKTNCAVITIILLVQRFFKVKWIMVNRTRLLSSDLPLILLNLGERLLEKPLEFTANVIVTVFGLVVPPTDPKNIWLNI